MVYFRGGVGLGGWCVKLYSVQGEVLYVSASRHAALHGSMTFAWMVVHERSCCWTVGPRGIGGRVMAVKALVVHGSRMTCLCTGG